MQALSNAERQRRWRERQVAKLKAAERGIASRAPTIESARAAYVRAALKLPRSKRAEELVELVRRLTT